ncbi:MAG: acyltransferase family protein [Nocardioidaceae bacterium]
MSLTAAAPATRRVEPSIEALRALAIVMVVAGHVVGNDATRGMRVADGSGWRIAYLALGDFPMPLFALIAGYVYALRPLRTAGAYPRFLAGKARRLLLPMVTIGTALFALELVAPATNFRPRLSELWRIYVYPFEHLWFLQALFAIFVAAGLLEVAGVLARRRRWAVAVAAAFAVYVAVPDAPALQVFMVGGAVLLLPFFLVGYGLCRHPLPRPARRAAVVFGVVAFPLLYALRMSAVLGAWGPAPALGRGLGELTALVGVLLVYAARRLLTHRPAVLLGELAFAVYLLHVFATAGSRVALSVLGVHAPVPVFVVGLVLGVGAPVVAARLIHRSRVLSTLVLGERLRLRWAWPGPAVAEAPEGG